MSSDKKFGTLRSILRVIGLSQDAVDDIVDRIADLLVSEGKAPATAIDRASFPYHLRDNFLSPAELKFYSILLEIINGRAVLSTKVALGDIFYVKKADGMSHYRTYTNKIDRKHVDFLLCDSKTMQPIVGIELDDSSHQREDRRVRDEFVDGVFMAAKLPLLHIPVRREYDKEALQKQLSPFIKGEVIPQAVAAVKGASSEQVSKNSTLNLIKGKENTAPPPAPIEPETAAQVCPKCGSEMILRTAKSGANAGGQFWGCSGYPKCRTMLPHTN